MTVMAAPTCTVAPGACPHRAHTGRDALVSFRPANALRMGDPYLDGLHPFIDTATTMNASPPFWPSTSSVAHAAMRDRSPSIPFCSRPMTQRCWVARPSVIGFIYDGYSINRFHGSLSVAHHGPREVAVPSNPRGFPMSLINTEVKPFKAHAFHNGKFIEVTEPA